MTDKPSAPDAEDTTSPSADMLDAYIQGRLPPEQQAEFESWMMDKPELLEEAELGLLMQEGFRANEASVVVPFARPDDTPSERPAVQPQWGLAAAAAIVSLGVGSIFGYSLVGDPSDPVDSMDGLMVSQLVNLPITRSDLAPQIDVSIGDDADVVVLRVPLPNPESRPYTVTVSGESGSVGSVSRVRPDGGGVLTVSLSADGLDVGAYTITVDDGSEIEPVNLNITE